MFTGKQNTSSSRDSRLLRDDNLRPLLQIPALNPLSALPSLNCPQTFTTFLPDRSMQSYYTSQATRPVSPDEPSLGSIDSHRPSSYAMVGSPMGASVDMMAHNSKRAYRQRRKDPSCDACRERKVKCDATETTSCTECSSRNVRCQFTKDTNRRMSSIKQIQDLERQLREVRQQLEQARASDRGTDAPAAHDMSPTQVLEEIPASGKSPRRMLKARTPHDLAFARSQLSDIGRGVFKPPLISAHPRSHQNSKISLSQLPPHHVVEKLLLAYYETVHRQYPVLYWPEFIQTFSTIYDQETTSMIARDTTALVFVVLACGTIHFQPPNHIAEGQKLLERAISLIDMLSPDVSTTQAIVVFLTSVFLAEINHKTTSWIWLGSAIRVAQDVGLHVQGGQWSPVEGEMRKRIWYSFYIWDRLLAMEMGKPMLINDEECDTEYPEVHEDEVHAKQDELNPQFPALLLATIPIARLMSPLSKLCRSLCITNETLVKFESHLGSCMHLLPLQLQLSATSPLDPFVMTPTIYFQNTRLLLHRHNMSPSCSPDQRLQAINQCTLVAKETAKLFSRCMLSQGASYDWQERLLASSTTLVCTHIWRCMLFLAFQRNFDSFFILFEPAMVINNSRPVNISCGRHLAFFLQRLVNRIDQKGSLELEQDEEILVYLSGDLQGSTNSWVWGNAETGTLLSRRQKHGRSRPRNGNQEGHLSSPFEQTTSWDSLLSEEEQNSWGGWENVGRLARSLRQLLEKEQLIAGPPPVLNPFTLPPINAGPDPSRSPDKSVTSSTDASRSRMNIANII